MKSSIKVSAAIIHDGGKIFITRKAEGAFKGFWEFPGGKIEEGESASDAAVREIREELSILIERKKCSQLNTSILLFIS